MIINRSSIIKIFLMILWILSISIFLFYNPKNVAENDVVYFVGDVKNIDCVKSKLAESLKIKTEDVSGVEKIIVTKFGLVNCSQLSLNEFVGKKLQVGFFNDWVVYISIGDMELASLSKGINQVNKGRDYMPWFFLLTTLIISISYYFGLLVKEKRTTKNQ